MTHVSSDIKYVDLIIVYSSTIDRKIYLNVAIFATVQNLPHCAFPLLHIPRKEKHSLTAGTHIRYSFE